MICRSAGTGDALERVGGLADVHFAMLAADELRDDLEEARMAIVEARASYLACRIARRQAEALLEEIGKQKERARMRREQGTLEDWHRVRHQADPGPGGKTQRAEPAHRGETRLEESAGERKA